MEHKKNTCNICNKQYKTHQSLWNHKNKYHTEIPPFIPIIPTIHPHITTILPTNNIIKKTDKTSCDYCNKIFSCYNSLNRHLKTCKIKVNILQKNEEIEEKTLQEIEELKKENEEIKKAFNELKNMMLEMMNKNCKMHPKKFQKLINSTNHSNNNTNSNNTNSNNLTITNNNQINIIHLGDENLNEVFSKDEKLKILKRGYASLEEIIKHTHLNDKYLQFQNIIITNKRSNDAYVYTAELGKFILCDKREILEELIVYRMDDLVEFYNEYKNKLDPKIVKVLEKMFKLKDEDEYIDKKTNDFNIVFYNLSNKDLLKYKKIDELTV